MTQNYSLKNILSKLCKRDIFVTNQGTHNIFRAQVKSTNEGSQNIVVNI